MKAVSADHGESARSVVQAFATGEDVSENSLQDAAASLARAVLNKGVVKLAVSRSSKTRGS